MLTYLVAVGNSGYSRFGFVVSWDGVKLSLVPRTEENMELAAKQVEGRQISYSLKTSYHGRIPSADRWLKVPIPR